MQSETDKSIFSERIRKIIELSGSAEKLANNSGMSSRVIGQYLAGKSDPTRLKLIALADAALVNVEWLATGKGPMERGGSESINSELLSLVIEALEDHEKESDDKLPPWGKASFISNIYDLSLDEDLTTEEGKKSVKELVNMVLSFDKTIDKAIESEKGLKRVRKVLRREFKRVINKADAEFVAEEYIGARILSKHLREGTLKSIDEIKKMAARSKTKK